MHAVQLFESDNVVHTTEKNGRLRNSKREAKIAYYNYNCMEIDTDVILVLINRLIMSFSRGLLS